VLFAGHDVGVAGVFVVDAQRFVEDTAVVPR
jgi:hypothetical protein